MKKFICLSLIALFNFIFVFAACFPSSREQSTENNTGNSSSGLVDDRVLYTHRRLSNADFSFNFDLSNGSGVKSYAAATGANVKSSNRAKTLNKSAVYAQTVYEMDYNVTNLTFIEPQDYFESETQQLDSLRAEAVSLVDYCIKNITVLNMAVTQSSNSCVGMMYDAIEDKITVYRRINNDYTEIELYYNEEGEETIHMLTVSENNMSASEVYYIPGSYYYFSFKSNCMYHIALATKIDGQWEGISSYWQSDNSYITREGVYDYANGLIHITFLIEEGGELYTFSDYIYAVRDGGETGSCVEASPDDSLAIKQYWVNSPFGTYNFDANLLELRAYAVKGINTIHLRFDTEQEMASAPDYIHYYFYDSNDYIVLNDGRKLCAGDGWSREYGFIEFDTDCFKFRDENGRYIDESIVDNESGIVRFAGGEGYIYNLEFSGGYPLWFSPSGKTIEEKLLAIKDFFDAAGITFNENVNEKSLENLIEVQMNNEAYRDKLFEKLYNVEYTADNIITMYKTIMADYDEAIVSIPQKVKEMPVIAFEDMPVVSERADLLTISATDLVGYVEENSCSLALNGASVITPKSIILRDGETYGILVCVNNQILSIDAFGTATYANEDLTFTSTLQSLPLPKEKGEYLYTIKLVRINQISGAEGQTESEYIPISNSLLVLLPDVPAFEYDEDDGVQGGYYHYVYEIRDNTLNVTKEFIDTEAPCITINGLNEETKSIGLSCDAGIGDLRALCVFTDNYDTKLTIDDLVIKIKGSDAELVLTDLVTDATIYVITLTDAGGNTCSVEVLVNIIE